MNMAFLFDNDGVLIDSLRLHQQSWDLLKEEEPAFHMPSDYFHQSFGKRNDLILKDLFPNVPVVKRKAWAKRKEGLFRQCATGQIELLPGMEKFLQELRRKNIPRIIASSTSVANLEMYLSTTVLGYYFQEYASGEEVAYGKPAPDVFIAAANKLGYDPTDCIVVEDAPAGITAGKSAGAFVIALETTHASRYLEGYDLIFKSPEDLRLLEIQEAFTAWKKKKANEGN